LDSKHGHELVYMLRVLPWDTLGASVGISTRTPYCSTVCLCLNNSLTHYIPREYMYLDILHVFYTYRPQSKPQRVRNTHQIHQDT